MKYIPSILMVIVISARAFAHTGEEREFVCPLDGTRFMAWEDWSGTSIGTRLDLKKIGPIAQPWALPQCPRCRFPLFKDEFDSAELLKIKKIVASEPFISAAKNASPYYALGILEEELQAPAVDVAWIFLKATWEAEENAEKYRAVAERAIEWFDKAAIALLGDQKRKSDYLVSVYLPIELLRRNGRFDVARDRLDHFPSTKDSEVKWLPSALEFQAKLISAHDSSAHNIGENEKKK
jgi:hypothetical protein